MKWEWESQLRRLALLYRRGQLVPFVGAGMSVPAIPAWYGLLKDLAKVAEVSGPSKKAGALTLVRDAQRITRALRGRGPRCLSDAISGQFAARDHKPTPSQTVALSRLWWPLIVTTNYDAILARAIAKQWGEAIVVGRSDLSCFEVASTLTGTMPPTIWAIQGFVGKEAGNVSPMPGLADEIVLGHAQYREVTYRQPGFRRTFSEVVRARSFLFLGSSLEPYLLELLSEVRELHGANHLWHYALVPNKPEFNSEWYEREYQIRLIHYRNHAELPHMLDRLRRESESIYSQTIWQFVRPIEKETEEKETEEKGTEEKETENRSGVDDQGEPQDQALVVEIHGGKLPTSVSDNECVIVSAGGRASSDRLHFSRKIQDALLSLKVTEPLEVGAWRPLDRGRYFFQSSSNPRVYAARARDEEGGRSLESVWRATMAALHKTEDIPRLHLQLLASGSGLSRAGTFVPRHALAIMLRALGRDPRPGRVILHVVDPSIIEEMRRGRLTVEQHLSSRDIRYWVTVEFSDVHTQRHVDHVGDRSAQTIGDLAKSLGVPGDWRVEIWPTWLDQRSRTVSEIEKLRLNTVLVPECTVRFTAHDAAR